jgi:hypothetical protein
MSATEVLPPSRQRQEATYPRFSFITVLDPGESKLPSKRKAVRSHAALYQTAQERMAGKYQAQKKQPRKRKRKALSPGEWIIVDTDPSSKPPQEGRESILLAELQGRLAHQFSHRSIGPLGAGRVDPFRTYPVPWEPFIPELVDHYSYLSGFFVKSFKRIS